MLYTPADGGGVGASFWFRVLGYRFQGFWVDDLGVGGRDSVLLLILGVLDLGVLTSFWLKMI